jgi:hypothetical protein
VWIFLQMSLFTSYFNSNHLCEMWTLDNCQFLGFLLLLLGILTFFCSDNSLAIQFRNLIKYLSNLFEFIFIHSIINEYIKYKLTWSDKRLLTDRLYIYTYIYVDGNYFLVKINKILKIIILILFEYKYIINLGLKTYNIGVG